MLRGSTWNFKTRLLGRKDGFEINRTVFLEEGGDGTSSLPSLLTWLSYCLKATLFSECIHANYSSKISLFYSFIATSFGK